MTYREAMFALQLAAEERMGFVGRERERLARAELEAAYARADSVAASLLEDA